MKETFKASQPKYAEGIFSAISIGFFLVLVGAIFAAAPDLSDKILTFFRNFDIVNIPNTEIFLPGPTSPNAHSVVYLVAGQFSLIWGVFQVAILALRFFARSPLNKKAETVSNIVFWLGASCLISVFLNEMTTFTTWFAFWAALIVLIGFSLIARAILLAAARAKPS